MVVSPSSNPAFAPLRAVLYLALSIQLITGSIGVYSSVFFINQQSQSLSQETVVDPFLNSEWRFISAMWLCYAPILFTISCNPPRYAPILRYIIAFVTIGGLGRCYTGLTLGWPVHPNASRLNSICIVFEFLLAALSWTLLDRGLKESGEKEN